MRTSRLLRRPARLAAVAFTTVLALSACGSGDDPTIGAGGDRNGVGASPVAGIDAEHNDADIAFIRDMKPHHEGAVKMAELAESRAASAELKSLARQILAAQGPEIETMNKMAIAWGVDLEASSGEHGGGHSGGMSDDAEAMEPLAGKEFDQQFLTRMIAHHEGAIQMAEVELDDGVNPQAKQMAEDIVASQTAEIADMKSLLAAS